MGGIGDMFFGSTTEPSISQAPTKTHSQRDLLDQLTKLLQGQIGTGVESYSGNMTAQPAELEKTAWGEIENLLKGGMQGRTAINQSAIDKIMQGTTNVPSYDVGTFDPTAIQDWYKNALVTPAMKTWEKDVAPVIQEKYIARNAGSSGAIGRDLTGSAENLMTSLNSQLADKLLSEKGLFDTREYAAGMQGTQNEFTAGQSDLSRILNVPAMESTDLDAFMKSIGLGTGAGATQRGIEQQGLNAEYQKWLASQGYANPYLNLLPSVLGTNTFENVVDPGTQTQGLLSTLSPAFSSYAGSKSGSAGITSLLSSLFGSGGGAAGATGLEALLPMLAESGLAISSIRYKKNIVPVGKTIAGLQPIEFEYTDEAIREYPNMTARGRLTGFLAEDVAEKYPQAVIFDLMGRPDAVNYGRLFQMMGG